MKNGIDYIIVLILCILFFIVFELNNKIDELEIKNSSLSVQLNTIQLQTTNTDFYSSEIKHISKNIKLKEKQKNKRSLNESKNESDS